MSRWHGLWDIQRSEVYFFVLTVGLRWSGGWDTCQCHATRRTVNRIEKRFIQHKTVNRLKLILLSTNVTRVYLDNPVSHSFAAAGMTQSKDWMLTTTRWLMDEIRFFNNVDYQEEGVPSFPRLSLCSPFWEYPLLLCDGIEPRFRNTCMGIGLSKHNMLWHFISHWIPFFVIYYNDSLILSYSWLLVSVSLSFCFLKDDLKLSTQDFSCSSDKGLPSFDIRTTTSALDFLSFKWSELYRDSRDNVNTVIHSKL